MKRKPSTLVPVCPCQNADIFEGIPEKYDGKSLHDIHIFKELIVELSKLSKIVGARQALMTKVCRSTTSTAYKEHEAHRDWCQLRINAIQNYFEKCVFPCLNSNIMN